MRNTLILSLAITALLAVSGSAAPSVANVSAPATAGLYNKYEVTFDVSTVAANCYWPYDESPNPGVPAGVGVSVDGLFTNDNWNTTIVQPGFIYQEYTRNDSYIAPNVWLYPTGNPVWQLRFAATHLGEWKFKIRVRDSSGTFTTDERSFNCVASSNHGFVRVSPSDGRYFELSDGTYLPMIGLSDVSIDKYPQLADMGINLVRTWWQSSAADGNKALFGAGGQGGDRVWQHLQYSGEVTYPGDIVSAIIPTNAGDGDVFSGLYTQPTVKPNTHYRFTGLVKTVGITGSGDYGVRLRVQGVVPRSERVTGDTGWREIILDYTSLSGYYITTASIGMQNVTSGTAYCARLSLREDLGGGQYGPELLSRADFHATRSYPQSVAWFIDRQLEAAASNGIFVKAILEEKGDSFFGCILGNGTWTSTRNDNNVYASATHACRTYQQYYWRYVIARYGFSTALHDVEFCNEGDPFNTLHYDAVAAMGAYFRANDPNKHLATSSNWHSFPPRMWRSADVDIADIHMYLGWRIASGGNRLWPGWDGFWNTVNGADDTNNPGVADGFEWDTTVKHSGSRSMKIMIPPMPGDHQNRFKNSKAFFQCGPPPNHIVRISLWTKGQNLVTYNQSWIQPAGLALQYSEGGGDFAGYVSGTGSCSGAWGTYDWQKVQFTFTVPEVSQSGASGRLPLNVWVTPYARANNSDSPGYMWIDDVVVEDMTTGEVVNYNGGFEYIDSESYDVVAAHCAYSRLARSYALNKPVIRGETAFCYTQRFASPYKGFDYAGNSSQPGEDQLLVDDSDGVWWKKWVWAHTDPGGLIEIYWWSNLQMARSFSYGKAYQNFMSGIPLSNGHYQDACAVASNPAIRVLGQKDLTNNKAYLWIDNAPYTWKNVVDGVNVPLVSGTVTISGFADGFYKADWWNTSTGVISRTEDIQCSGGNIQLSLQNLQSDIACKIAPRPARIDLRILVP
ncbi:MAG: hypothetical protein ACYC0V_21560, partial [Armatimonadota bacterium]